MVGLISAGTGAANFTMADGGTLQAAFTGGFVAPTGMVEASDEAELSSCTAGCYLRQDLGGGLSRVRITDAGGMVVAGGLRLMSNVGRRVRWDLCRLES